MGGPGAAAFDMQQAQYERKATGRFQPPLQTVGEAANGSEW